MFLLGVLVPIPPSMAAFPGCSAQRALDRIRPPKHDGRGEYAEFRYPPSPDDLPADPRRRLLHIATHPELHPWIPTSEQCDRCKLDAAEHEAFLATA
jgi:hypothetical protein